MNCPKCGSPLNPGDKFCQVCGSAVEVPNQAAPEQPQPMPQAAPQPMPQPAPAPMPAPMPQPAPVEKKNSNTLVVVLVGVIAVLVVVIVAILFLGKGKEENKTASNGGTDPTTVAKKEEPKYSEVNLDNMKFKLLPGYSAEKTAQGNLLYNVSTQGSQAMVSFIEGHSVSDLDAVSSQAYFKENGFETTYKELTLEGKKAVLFTGKYSGYDYEVLYVQESATTIIGADIYYATSSDFTADADNMHKMIALVTKVDSSYHLETLPFGNFGKTVR